MDKSQPDYNQWVCNSIALFAANKTADFDFFMFKDGFYANRAEAFLNKYGATKSTKIPGVVMTNSASGDWLMLPGIDLGTQDKGTKGLVVNVASAGIGSLEVWEGNIDGSGKLLCTVAISSTGGADTWKDFNASVTTSGQQDIYLRWVGGANAFFVNTIRFVLGTDPVTSMQEETFINEQVLVFPNPFNSLFSIKSKGEFYYTVYNISGGVVEKGIGYDNSLAGNNLQSGIYVVKVHNGSSTQIIKVTKD